MKVLIFYPFYFYAMKIYHKDKDYEKANKFYQIAERFCPNHTENLFKIGMCYKKCKNYKEASQYFEKALELDSENEKYKEQFQIAKMRDFALFAPTKLWWQEIIAIEEEIKQKGESYGKCLNLAEDCIAMHYYDKAVKAYKRAIALCEHKENLAQLYYEMGYAYENLSDEVSLRLAKETYAQAIKLDEELESKRYGIGVFHFAKERWRFANRAFLEQLHSCDSDDLLLKKIGESFEWLYDWQNAMKYYQESLKLNYQNPQTHFRLGFVQERMGDLKGAVESYTQGVNRNNDLNNYWIYRLGFCLSSLQDFEGATYAFLNLQTTNAYPLLVGGGGIINDTFLEESKL